MNLIEELKELYCNKYLSKEDCAKELNIPYCRVNKLIKEYNLTRDMHDVRSKKAKNAMNVNYNKLKEDVTKEMLYDYYIVENHSYSETIEYFHLTGHLIDRLLSEYNIHKDKKVSNKMSLETKYRNAGGKAIYDKQAINNRNNTIIKKYGSMENFYQVRRENTEKNSLEKCGFKSVRTAQLLEKHSPEYLQAWHSKEYSINYLKSFNKKQTVDQLALALTCSVNCIHLWIERYDLGSYIKITKSHYEEDIINFIRSFNIEVDRNNRTILNGQELDIYIPEKKIAIEFNGDYWHDESKVGRSYHFNKSYQCEQLGIRLIHIYQYQWQDPIKQNILKSIIKNALGLNDNIIYARKCELKELDKKDIEEFSDLNSLHAHRNASIYLGLFYNDELVEVMTFGKAFFSRDKSIDYECIRSITKINTTVVGGMNKLFNYFIKKYNPNKVLYYVDYNTHIGNSMSKLGFDFIDYSKGGIVNVSNCKECIEKYGLVFNRKPQKHKEIQAYVDEGKILTIYDAGVKKYIWIKKA